MILQRWIRRVVAEGGKAQQQQEEAKPSNFIEHNFPRYGPNFCPRWSCYPTKSQPSSQPPPSQLPNPAQPKSTTQSTASSATPTTPAPYRTDYELSGSYVSLECPSPPGPPACGPDGRRGDPQARLANYLRTLYTELALKEPVLPSWVHPVAPGVLCPARLEPELRLHIHSHGLNEAIGVDQILTPVQTKDGPFLEAPRRVLIECPPWVTRGALALRILHGWSREPPWPPRGQPVALALFLPLAELRGTIANYIGKELLPRGPPNPFASGFGGFSAAWNSLEALKGKLLIVLDGYDVQCKTRKSKTMPRDVIDLLEGRLFPEARVILISVTASCTELLPLMQRHITFEGLVWGRSVSLLGGGQWGAPTRLIDTVQSCRQLRNIARTTLGCLAIAAMYESSGGELPTDELDVIASVFNCVAANSSHTQVTELGRLALFCLKTKRSTVTAAELKMYCSAPETNIAGCLDRAQLFGRTAKRKSDHYYTIICPGLAEFLAANYIVSLANRPGLLAAEIAGLAVGDEVEPEILKVLNFSMALLGARAHLLLSKLTPLWLSPQTIFSLALAGGETEANLTALCEMLGISKSPPVPPLEAKPIWVSIKSTLSELQGWGLAFKSPTCTLKNLELVYQMEKNLLLESRNVMDIFLDALSKNESVTTLRITSLIENEVRDSDINYLASCISKALLKPRLESFELILTLLEEDPPILKLQSVVTALCRTIPRQPKLSNLSLDLGLCTSQLVQICATLEKCPHVTRLSLPHLRCERGAVGALAALLTVRPLSYLGLPSSWGARDDPPSSSGVSMGSGSGSSSGNSGLIKQSSLTGAPSPRSYPAGIFSSLPRGVLSSTANMGRSATLPRQPMEGPPDKRSTDSVISRTWYPTPACDGGPHNSGTLHELLLAARDTYSRLHGLDLSKAQLSLEDSMCLGETVRVSTTLHSIKLEGASRLSEILPTVLGASESPCLQMMSLGSPRIALEDAAVGMSARALGSCITLRLLSLDGWSFRIENVGTLASVRGFLSLTSVRELGLNNCRLNMSMFKSDVPVQSGAYECRSVVNLKLAGAQIIFADHLSMKGPHMLPYLVGFVNLRELDLSAPSRTGFGSTSSTPLILSDKDIVAFFNTLNNHFSHLNTLKMCNWIIHLDEAVRTLKSVAKLLKSSPLSHIKLDGVVVMDRPKKQRIEPQFLHAFLANLPLLRWLGTTLHGLSEEQITTLGNYCGDMRGMEIDVSHLNTLKMCNWIIHLDEAVRTLKSVAKLLKSSPLSHIKLDGVVVMDRPKKQRIEPQFLHAFLANLPLLRWLGTTLHGLSEEQITTLGNYCGDMRGMEIDVRLSDSTIENARLMTSSLGMDGKFDIRVSTFGTTNSILIHIEKTSTKSLSRK
ncbi:AGAP013057-PA [Anopheles gambiae str. PEST]|uniref:AGAP013057-PA n=2 Tax=Anopheles gambiae TaxID=7165 RepID=F5HLJ7_ANOGA|nr:AGAP013057-PA [Anopheles gambiae str. PEST]